MGAPAHHHLDRLKHWWSSPWLPLGPAVAGFALSLGFHTGLWLWEQTKIYEPLEPLNLSPPFAEEPLPGTSLDNLLRRYGDQPQPLPGPTNQQAIISPPGLPPGIEAEGTTGSD